jgi:hypothetical protein
MTDIKKDSLTRTKENLNKKDTKTRITMLKSKDIMTIPIEDKILISRKTKKNIQINKITMKGNEIETVRRKTKNE